MTAPSRVGDLRHRPLGYLFHPPGRGVLLSPVLDDALGSRTAVRRVQVEDHLVHPLVQQRRRLVEVPEAGIRGRSTAVVAVERRQ